jgi:Uma2 family endonuclease
MRCGAAAESAELRCLSQWTCLKEASMAIAGQRVELGRMSGAEFRRFQEGRPDHERWELVRGVPVMMVPPTLAHNHIASNLQRLLNEALAKHNPGRVALQRSGIELADDAGLGEHYRPEPDVVVMDAQYHRGQRFIDRAYVLAEVVSDTDNEPVPGAREPWIEVKRRLYLAHPPCEAVILIEPDRIEVRIDLRTKDRWVSSKLTRLDDRLTVPSCGLQCLVAELYGATPLGPRGA